MTEPFYLQSSSNRAIPELFHFRNKIKPVNGQTSDHEIVGPIRSAPMPDSQTEPKTYASPRLNKLTPEQAKLLLIGQATQGDPGVEDLLEVSFPDPNEHEKVSPRNDGDKSGGFVTKNPSRPSRLFIRA
jgi:hypothetical protein